MLGRVQFWTLTALAAITAVLIAANMFRFSENRRLQAAVNERGQFIQQTVPLETLSREIALALAQLGVREQDEQINALLSSLGITVTITAPDPETAPAQRQP